MKVLNLIKSLSLFVAKTLFFRMDDESESDRAEIFYVVGSVFRYAYSSSASCD